MDAARRAHAPSALIFRGTILLLFVSCSLAFALPLQDAQDLATAQKLSAEERWQDVVSLVEHIPQPSPDLQFYHGLALAHLERWDDARMVFVSARHAQPGDKRFPTELAGLAFRRKKYPEAAAYLRAALRLDPKDNYANDFLATVYFLEGNLEAALKYWNGLNDPKPRIEQVRLPEKLRVNPVLLDHAFAFSPASILVREELLATEARLNMLEVFPSYRLDLLAHENDKFDLQFQAQERNGWGNSMLEALLGTFRGLPFQEVNPEYFNIHGSATNFVSRFRWDAQKRRVTAFLSGPFLRNPQWRYRLSTDGRDENWEIRKSFAGIAPALAGLNLRRAEVAAEITRLVGWRWSWSAGVQLSRRDYRDVAVGTALTPSLLAHGYELSELMRLRYLLWRVPERRLTLDSEVSAQAGRLWSTLPESFLKTQAEVNLRWLPRSRGDDYATRWVLQAGNIAGQFPFDELFMLGLERDNDLWLRAHIGTRDGRKGSAPLGRRYFLSNWETDKNVYRNGIFTVKLGPFLDTGKIGGVVSALSSQKWLWDAGAQCKVSVFGVGVSLIYGKDLRSGNNAFYATVAR